MLQTGLNSPEVFWLRWVRKFGPGERNDERGTTYSLPVLMQCSYRTLWAAT